ncbi:MAG TPA: RelA/SpoT domain-containing protein [Candidatus Acidoferrales bacterium]|jgi:putative GTP pyrophosphokinase|nr:RelA/SpoT domain-containing protein [Candidatus Acidoferrales bacterium]
MASPENRASIDEVLEQFDRKRDILEALCAKTKGLIEASLQEAPIQYQSVQTRVKTRRKVRAKYLDQTKDYRKLDDITDLAGLRVITYYTDDVDRVADVIRQEFDLDSENSVDKRPAEPDRFGYRAINLVCRHLQKRTSDVEYKKFAGIPCEIQVTSILSHAWSEIEHEWYDLRDAYPDEIKREFSRLAALFEIADSKFLDIRKARNQYERSVAVRVEAMVPDLPVDVVSLRSFIEQEPLVAEVDKAIAAKTGLALLPEIPDSMLNVRSKGLGYAGFKTLQQVSEGLRKFRTAIPEYVERCRKEGVWAPAPKGTPVAIGISVFHLAGFSASLGGVEAISKYNEAMVIPRGPNYGRQVEIAKQVAAKFKG